MLSTRIDAVHIAPALSLFSHMLFLSCSALAQPHHNHTQTRGFASVDLVVAKYQEDTSWADVLMHCAVFVYEKSPLVQEKPAFAANATGHRGRQHRGRHRGQHLIKTPDIGREDWAYLFHVTQHYHNLADVTIFVQGIPFTHQTTPQSLQQFIIQQNMRPKFEALSGVYLESDADGLPHHASLCVGWGPKCIDRLFGVLLEFEDRCTLPKSYLFSPGAQYAVPRASILSHSLAYYERMLSISAQTKQNTSVACAWERLWPTVLHLAPEFLCRIGQHES
jgi:hypothetical protein